jgi:hypothetical protein
MATPTIRIRLLPAPTVWVHERVVEVLIPVLLEENASGTAAGLVATETIARRLAAAPTVWFQLRVVATADAVSFVELLSKVMTPVASRFEDTETIATGSLPDPTVWFQFRLAAPASAVLALETASKAIGSVPAGLVTLVLSTVIERRYSYWARAGTLASERRTASAAQGSARSRLHDRARNAFGNWSW